MVLIALLAMAPGFTQEKKVMEAWVRAYNGPAGLHDGARAVAVDAEGNVYVTGRSLTGRQFTKHGSGPEADAATVKYDVDGDELWVARYDGPQRGTVSDDEGVALAVDGAGSVYVAARSGAGVGADFATIKYTADGQEDWVARLGYAETGEMPSALALDRDGNVYVTGTSLYGTGAGILTVKYTPDGHREWRAEHLELEGAQALCRSLALGAKNEIYVLGEYCDNGGTHCEFLTLKYDAHGHEIWARRESRASSRRQVTAFTVDALDNVYVTGTSTLPDGDDSFLTIKYDAAGRKRWAATFGSGDVQSSDRPVGLVTDAAGNIFVAGSSCVGDSCVFSGVLYDGEGHEVWTATSKDPASASDTAAVVASDGKVFYVSGSSLMPTGKSELTTVKYDGEGREVWAIKTSAVQVGRVSAIALASDGSVAVAGETSQRAGYTDYVTASYEQQQGQPFWRGDFNADGSRNLTDAIDLLRSLFQGGEKLPCQKSADANDDGTLNLADPIFLLRFLFLGGPAPDARAPGCAVDTTPDRLDCASYACK
jgi:hypothetical protein